MLRIKISYWVIVLFVASSLFLPFGVNQAGAWFLGSSKRQALEPPFPLPQLQLESITEGNEIALEKFKGSVLLVNFWATWCQPCVAEMPALNKLYEDFGDEGFSVVGISMNTGNKRPVKQLTNKMKINYPVVIGSKKIAQNFGEIVGIPVTFLVNREGTVIKRYDGPRDHEAFAKDIKIALQQD